jgi:hypothetical protein
LIEASRSRSLRSLAALAFCMAAGCSTDPLRSPSAVAASASTWQVLEPGLDLGFLLSPRPVLAGDGVVRVLRADPDRFELRLLTASAEDGRPRTARQWSLERDLLAAVNASMYQQDYSTSVSLMRTRSHVNNARLTRHRAVLAFEPLAAGVPPVKMIDLDCDDFGEWKDRYGSFVQSIRMLSCDGRNVWQPQAQRWSTAAVGIDAAGRVLLVHVRSPFPTHELIDLLIELPLDLRSLMYAEGGPEAQLFVRGPEREYEFVGSFAGAFGDADDNHRAWPIPNVLGIARRAAG